MKMKKILFVALSLLLLLAFGCSHDTNNSSVTNPNPNTVYPKGYIQGYVLDACTRAPIVGAVVDIGIKQATTNANGQYIMRDVPATSYTDNVEITGDLAIGTNPPLGEITVGFDSGYRGTYSATVDMTKAKVNGIKATTIKYADKYYEEVEVRFASLEPTSGIISSDNADVTPVLGIANGDYDFLLGQLTSGITGYAVYADNVNSSLDMTPVPQGWTVYLLAINNINDGDQGNSSTGGTGNLVQKTTTDANGKFVFNNLEASQPFRIIVVDLANETATFRGYKNVSTDCNGRMLYFGIQDGSAVRVTSTDRVCPFPLSFTVDGKPNHSDISKDLLADGVNIVITFNEPILPTALNTGRALLSQTNYGPFADGNYTDSGLYSDIRVGYEGFKFGNIHHTMSWVGYVDETNPGPMRQLQITIPPEALQPASLYSVTIMDGKNLRDLNGHALTTRNGTWDEAVPSTYTCAPEVGTFMTIVPPQTAPTPVSTFVSYFFTTYGVVPAGKVTNLHSRVTGAPEDDNSLDFDDNATIDWTAAAGAKSYNIYCRMIQWRGSSTVSCEDPITTGDYHPYHMIDNTVLTGYDLNFQGSGSIFPDNVFGFEYVESLNIRLSYECYVRAVDADGIEGPDESNHVFIEDTDAPHIISVQEVQGTTVKAITGGDTITGLRVCFSEPMNELSVESATWTVTTASFVTATATSPLYGTTIATRNYDPMSRCYTITFDDAIIAKLIPASVDVVGTPPASATITVLSLTSDITGIKDVAGNSLIDPPEGSATKMLPGTFIQSYY